MKKTTLIASLLVLALSAGSVLAASAVCARVYQFGGTVRFQPPGYTNWHIPVVKMSLREGDTVRTGTDGWLTIAFENASLIRLQPGSQVVISKANYDAKEKALEADIRFPGTGKLLAVVRKLARRDNSVNVYTPVAVAGVRGTDLMVESGDGTATVAVFEGKIIVKDLVAEQGLSTDDNALMLDFLREMDVGSGKVTTYQKGRGLQKSKPIGAKLKDERAAVQALKAESQKLEKSLAAGTADARTAESERARADAVK